MMCWLFGHKWGKEWTFHNLFGPGGGTMYETRAQFCERCSEPRTLQCPTKVA